MSILNEPPIDLAQARRKLSELVDRRRELLMSALVLLAAVGPLVVIGVRSGAIACGVGAGLALLLSGQCSGDRRRLLTRLVGQGDAESLPEVREFAHRLLSAAERRRLQRALRDAAAAGSGGREAAFTVIRPERAEAVAHHLQALADRIGDPATAVSAQALALCRRLLSDGVRSPLLNPHLNARETERIITVVQERLCPK